MLAKAQKWGNSLAVRLPKSMAEECGITADSYIELSRENKIIVIKPVKKKFSLQMLLAQVTSENLHSEVLDGEPRGKELL